MRLARAIGALVIAGTGAWAVPVRADRLNLEVGATLGGSITARSGVDSAAGVLGLSGQASYELPTFSIGLRTRGTFANKSRINVRANSYHYTGSNVQRQAAFQALFRFFPSTDLGSLEEGSWYLEGGPLVMETEFVGVQSVQNFPAPSSPVQRLFIQGSGISVGAGLRRRNSNWFFQVNYEVQRFNRLELVGEENLLNEVYETPEIQGSYYAHIVFVTIGLDVFGR